MKQSVISSLLFYTIITFCQDEVSYTNLVFPNDLHLKPLVFAPMDSSYDPGVVIACSSYIRNFINSQKLERGISHLFLSPNEEFENINSYYYIVKHKEVEIVETTGSIDNISTYTIKTLTFYFESLEDSKVYKEYGVPRKMLSTDSNTSSVIRVKYVDAKFFFEDLTKIISSQEQNGNEKPVEKVRTKDVNYKEARIKSVVLTGLGMLAFGAAAYIISSS